MTPGYVLRASPRWAAVAFALAALAPHRALADPATAETLFREGRELYTKGEIAKACALFADSQRLDPSSGTLINLAACREDEGKLASAWADFVSAARLARAEGKQERAEEADRRAGVLVSRVPHVRITAPPNTPKPILFRDGNSLGGSAFDRNLPVDPGLHLYEVRAEGRSSWSLTHESFEGKMSELPVPELGLVPVMVPVPIEPPVQPPPKPSPPPDSEGRQQVLAGWLTFGGGALLGSVGAIVGGVALANNQESEALCESRQDCSQDALDAYDRADALAWAANVLIPLGAVAASAGIIVVLTAPDEVSGTDAQVTVQFKAGPAGLVIDGVF